MWEGNREKERRNIWRGGGGGLNGDGERRWPRIVKEEIERESGKGGGGARGKEAKRDARTGEPRGMERVYLCVREKGL